LASIQGRIASRTGEGSVRSDRGFVIGSSERTVRRKDKGRSGGVGPRQCRRAEGRTGRKSSGILYPRFASEFFFRRSCLRPWHGERSCPEAAFGAETGFASRGRSRIPRPRVPPAVVSARQRTAAFSRSERDGKRFLTLEAGACILNYEQGGLH